MVSKRPGLAYTLRQEKSRHIRLRKDRFTPPAVGVQDEPTRCYRLNNQWAKIIMGWVSMLTEIKGWAGATDERHPGIVGVETFLLGEDCMSFQMRQNPTNLCLIEQSTDGGLSWTSAFDLSLCTSIVDGSSQTSILNNFYNTVFNSFQENVYNDYVSNYINSITDIAPELGYGDSDDNFRDSALCYSLGKFVDSVSDSALAFFDDLDSQADDLLLLLALAAAIIGVVGLAATGVGTPAAIALAGNAMLLASGIGIARGFAGTLYAHFSSTNRSAYEDLQAREDVVCCLLDTLKTANVDRDDFENAFVCTGLSVNAQAIHDAAAIFATEDATYAAFVENMRIGFNSAKLGLLPACPCGGGWAYEVDFTAGVGLWSTIVGTHIPGIGLESVASASGEGIGVMLETASPYVWSYIEAEYTRSADGSFLDDFRVIVWTDYYANTGRYNWIDVHDPVGGTIIHCETNPAPPARKQLTVFLRDNQMGETITLKRIKVYNTGEALPPAPLIDNSTPRCT